MAAPPCVLPGEIREDEAVEGRPAQQGRSATVAHGRGGLRQRGSRVGGRSEPLRGQGQPARLPASPAGGGDAGRPASAKALNGPSRSPARWPRPLAPIAARTCRSHEATAAPARHAAVRCASSRSPNGSAPADRRCPSLPASRRSPAAAGACWRRTPTGACASWPPARAADAASTSNTTPNTGSAPIVEPHWPSTTRFKHAGSVRTRPCASR